MAARIIVLSLRKILSSPSDRKGASPLDVLGAELVPAKRAELIFTFARYRFYSWLYSSGIKNDKFIEGKFLSLSLSLSFSLSLSLFFSPQ